ncbi:MAG: ABC transporter ATP-binding protein [Rhizobacter sp.]|nr:ABC transporter ATP-binding protein [Chlorobiales bacterium]
MNIRAENITKKYGDFTALNGVSFESGDGEFFSVLGKSGSGKTTLIRIIAGLERPDAGKIYFDGVDIDSLPAHKRGAVMVFQNYALFPHLNVFDNVAFGLEERRVPKTEIRKTVVRTLVSLGIDGKMYRGISELSGGEQQRVAIARALAIESKVILFDEPLSNLDVALRKELQRELKSIQRQTGRNFIYITHDQEEALMLSDKLIVMDRGSVYESGTPQEVYEQPKSLFGASFIGNANVLQLEKLDRDKFKTSTGLVLKNNGEIMGKYFDAVVRPEHIVPSQQGMAGNVFKASIAAKFFRGAFFEYSLTVEGVSLVMLTQHDLRSSDAFIAIEKFFIFPKDAV